MRVVGVVVGTETVASVLRRDVVRVEAGGRGESVLWLSDGRRVWVPIGQESLVAEGWGQ